MKEYQYIDLREKPELTDRAARWFHSKWGVPVAVSYTHLTLPTMAVV